MKTYVKKQPFKVADEVSNFISIVLSEQETYWVYHDDNKCYPFMIGLIKKNIEKIKKKYNQPIKLFTNEGVIVKLNNLDI
jgi:hypothetical protein